MTDIVEIRARAGRVLDAVDVLRHEISGLVDAVTGDPPPRPDPVPDPGPDVEPLDLAGVTHVVSPDHSDRWYPLAAVDPTPGTNPPGAQFPGGRGHDQLVAYTAATATNRWGAAAQVDHSGRVLRVWPQEDTAVPVPPGGVVLSGHGAAEAWIRRHLIPGRVVWFSRDPVPGPRPPADGWAVDVYKKVWQQNTGVSVVPSGATGVRLAFAQGSPPSLVGPVAWMGSSPWDVSVSVGGAGGRVDLSDPARFAAGINGIAVKIGKLSGLDWDIETGASLPVDDVVKITRLLRVQMGAGFRVTMAPNGSNVDAYLPAAVRLHREGLLGWMGQQFYDAPVTLAQVKGRLREALDAGLPETALGVGMMTTPSGDAASGRWSLDYCAQVMTEVRATWPDIRRTYLWAEDHHYGSGVVARWVDSMRGIVEPEG